LRSSRLLALQLLVTAFGLGFTRKRMMKQKPFQRVREILEQMPAIGHLLGLRCSHSSAFRVSTGAISANDFYPWMTAKPICTGFREPIGQ
jgi:hypothetical protein